NSYSLFHSVESIFVYQIHSFSCFRNMQRDEITQRPKFIKTLNSLCTEFINMFLRCIRVTNENFHSEGNCSLCNTGADFTESDNPKCLVENFVSGKFRAFPFSAYS